MQKNRDDVSVFVKNIKKFDVSKDFNTNKLQISPKNANNVLQSAVFLNSFLKTAFWKDINYSLRSMMVQNMKNFYNFNCDFIEKEKTIINKFLKVEEFSTLEKNANYPTLSGYFSAKNYFKNVDRYNSNLEIDVSEIYSFPKLEKDFKKVVFEEVHFYFEKKDLDFGMFNAHVDGVLNRKFPGLEVWNCRLKENGEVLILLNETKKMVLQVKFGISDEFDDSADFSPLASSSVVF